MRDVKGVIKRKKLHISLWCILFYIYIISESIVNIKLIRVLLGQHWISTVLALLVDAPPRHSVRFRGQIEL